MDAWNSKLFSEGGREILIKTVIQAIPMYDMPCFRIPSTINKEIENMISNFWWGGNVQGKKIWWKNWKSLIKPKNKGGLGFRDLTILNKALLAKQVWRFIVNPNSLTAKVFKAWYYTHMNVMEAPLGSNPSYIWRSMCWSRDILHNGLF